MYSGIAIYTSTFKPPTYLILSVLFEHEKYNIFVKFILIRKYIMFSVGTRCVLLYKYMQ